MTGLPPAGWYPAPHANNEQRYWDGEKWLEIVPPPVVAAAPEQQGPTPQAPGSVSTSASAPSPEAPSTASPWTIDNGHPGRVPERPTPARAGTGQFEAVPTPAPRSALARTALIFGIVGIASCWIPWLGLIIALGGLGFGIASGLRKERRPMLAAGFTVSALAVIISFLVTVSFTSFLIDRTGVPTAESASASRNSDVAEATTAPAPVEAETAAPTPAEPEPTANVPAEATPSEPAGSVTNPIGQPYVAEGLFGGDKYSLTARVVDANANALVEDWNQFNSDAPVGYKYVVVELSMSGLDPDGVEPSIAGWDLYLATAEGNRYDGEYIVLGDGMSSLSDGPTLYPGSSFTGYTAYVVPEAAQDFLLYDNGKYIRL